jgi:hypothetical protein
MNDGPDITASVDRAFSRFGSTVSSVVYWKFHFDTKLDKGEIALRPDLFSTTIREIFRDGSSVVERAIIQELRSQFDLPNRNYKDLEDAVTSIKLRTLSNSVTV